MACMIESSSRSLSPTGALSDQKESAPLDAEFLVPTEVSPVPECVEFPVYEEEQKRTSSCPDILCQDKADIPRAQSSLTKSLQKAEALLRNRLNPGLKWLLKQKSDDGNVDTENEDTFVAGQNLTTRSSCRLQQVEQSMLGLSQQFQVQRDLDRLGSCGYIRRFCLDGEFYHHPAAATVGRHHGMLHDLLEERAQLLFLHEYVRRCMVASSFVANLTVLLEGEGFSLAAGAEGPEQLTSIWQYGISALCMELRIHVNHWNCLYAKARMDKWLRGVLCRRSRTFCVMKYNLWLLGVQALTLMEQYISKALSVYSLANPSSMPREALDDLLAGTKAFNHILTEQRLQMSGYQLKRPTMQILDQMGFGEIRVQIDFPSPLPVSRLLEVLAKHRGWMAAEQLHHWLANKKNFTSASNNNVPWSQKWNLVGTLAWEPAVASLCNTSGTDLSSTKLNSPLVGSPGFTVHPLETFVNLDMDFREKLLQALVCSSDLFVPHVANRPKSDRLNMVNCSLEDGPRNHHQDDAEAMDVRGWKFVQWQDIGRMDASLALISQYGHMLWQEFRRALLTLLYCPQSRVFFGNLNLLKDHMAFLVVKELYSSRTGLPAKCVRVINDVCTEIVARTAFMHWDEVMCASLGTGLKDRCLPHPGATLRTLTMELFLQLFHPLHTVLNILDRSTVTPDTSCDLELRDARTQQLLQLGLLSRAVSTIHSSTFWLKSKAYQFLSSRSLSKFLLVTQGELKVLKATVEGLMQQMESIPVDQSRDQSLVKRQITQLSQRAKDLQVFSDLILKTFSVDCKKMAGEIFEQTMPSGKQWRLNCKTELPSSPSEYAVSAVQNVIVQVLEGVQPLPDEARVSALSEAMTAFMEAWMEHILKRKIKFSVQGALQLKQDFDLIRDLIRSEEYSLSQEVHQHLLSLGVFHQVDSAIVCLLQQPVAKPYMAPHGWEVFRRCCPSSRRLADPGPGSLNSLESMDIQAARNQALMEAQGSLGPRLLCSSPLESYLAISQQEWLALRLHGGFHRKIPGLHCMNKPEH